jgi:hypothetical protein
MAKVRDTEQIRKILRRWADDGFSAERRDRAQIAYLSTAASDGNDGRPIFYIIVDDELLAELQESVAIEVLP